MQVIVTGGAIATLASTGMDRVAAPMSARSPRPTPQPLSGSPEYSLDAQIGFVLRKAHQRHRAIFSKQIGAKLAPTQFAVLASLLTDGPTSQNELGRRTAMDTATIAGVINRLGQRGLVSVGASDDDDRLSIVALTRQGRALVEKLLPRAHEISIATLAPLTAAESATLIRLLNKIA